MNVTLITACSSTRQIPPVVKVGDMPTELTMEQALKWWMEQLDKHQKDIITPREQYRGMGFMTLAKILALKGFEFHPFIVTGGQGLINLEEPIVPYDFTAGKKEPENIHQKVTAEPFVQTVWWRMINEARKGIGDPVANQIAAAERDLILIAMPKIFLRYISDDILTAKSLDKVRILLSASSLGSVPQQLRPWIVPYDRSAITHIPGNRNDNTHRAALLFLETIKKDPNILAMDAALQAHTIFETQAKTVSKGGLTIDQLKKTLADQPEILQLTPDEAYAVIRRQHGPIGGKMFFRGIFRTVAGHQVEVNDSKKEQERAVEALKGLNLSSAVVSDEEETLKGIKRFADAVKQLTPKASFTSTDISRWALNFYGEDKIPDLLASPNKLAHILKSNSDVLGIKPINEGKAYVLA